MRIKIGIVGYGNLGKGVELAIGNNEDFELVAIFTRREPNEIKTITGIEAIAINEIYKWQEKIDVLILCGGSATDLPIQTPEFAKMFNVVDSYDTHANILEHFNNVDKSAKEGKKVGLISCGWDPGLFSLNRLISESVLPDGNTYTFWGRGVSQGHSDAIRRIRGVKSAVQYTVPIENAIEKVKNGENPKLSVREKHIRECFVVPENGANTTAIEHEIKNMPNYFKEYDTTVHFISEAELKEKHSKMPHGGCVIRSGKTGINKETSHVIEYSLKLNSNPEFTGSILVTYARAVYKLAEMEKTGAITIFDIPPMLLTKKNAQQLLQEVL